MFVPGAYFIGTENGDGTYTCEVDSSAQAGSYTAKTAPVVMPIETPGYSAQAALTEYTSVTDYTDAGFVYVHAGCRGRDAGAPSGVTDLKAAIRYLRYTQDAIAGDTEHIFVFGMSGGGAQAAIVGASGDSALYDPYLEQIGAVQGVSDAVYGSMDWCPITNLDSADEAYEWMMGVTRSGLSTEEQQISDRLAAAFAEYINQAEMKDPNGNILTLEESESGIYQAGSYYDYMVDVIEESLNHFLADTEFPYDASASTGNDGGPGGKGGPGGDGGFGGKGDFEGDGGFGRKGGPGGDGGFDGKGDIGGDDSFAGKGDLGGDDSFAGKGDLGGDGGFGGNDAMNGSDADGDKEFPDMDGDEGDPAATDGKDESGSLGDAENESYEEKDNISRNQTAGGVAISGTYETVNDYIDALNANGTWVTYDESTNTAAITGIEDFVKAFKNASKNLGAFDQLDAGQGENVLFGYGDSAGAHFDATLSGILNDLGNEYASEFASDLEKNDAVGRTAEQRLHMYTPLYYLLESEEGYGTSTPAKCWRIRTGIAQSDTSVTTEVNHALALQNYDDVESVDFATVWGQQHVKAERDGNSTANFISWVDECMK